MSTPKLGPRIRLLVPKMPTADQVLPYLREIDEARYYTNFGPLCTRLEARLAERYAGAHVVTVSSCTLGLELAYTMYREMGLEEIRISPLTFQATALAAHRAGLRVRFRDPDPDTWSDGSVAAFGLPAWDEPVADCAAAFGEQTVPNGMVAVFSMHATKPLGAGEGGFIVTHDLTEAEELRSMTNFGFLRATRTAKYGLGFGVSRGIGTNAKLSEYHAAVALAALDQWNREPWLQLHDWYEQLLPTAVRRQARGRGVWPALAVKLPCPVRPVMLRMDELGIETRRWYTPPLYKHPLFQDDPAKYPVARDLADHLLGLPWHLHLTREDVRAVCIALTTAINEAPKP